jgi:predicted permease
MPDAVRAIPRVLDDLWRDIRHACRSLRKSPAVVVTCVLSLGVGIGVNATIFTVLRSVFLHQPTAGDADRVYGIEPGNGNHLSYPNFRDLHASQIFADVLGYRIAGVTLRADGTAQRLTAAVVTGNFFDVLDIRPQAGRTFAADERVPARHPRVVVISDAFWRRRFNGDAATLGRTVHLNGVAVDIVGILAADYRAVTPLGAPDVYVPISELFLPGLEDRKSGSGLSVIGRLRQGDTSERARMAVTTLGGDLEQRYPEANRGLSEPAAVFRLKDLVLRRAPPEMLLLPISVFVLFGLVLLIACGNVAGLLLARVASRRNEIAVRVALGAGRGRLVQALLAESLVLGLISAAGGILLTLMVLPVLNAVNLPGQVALRVSVAPDGTLLSYGLVLAIVTTITCGLIPALRATRVNVVADLNDAGTRATGRLRLRHAFVVGQVAVSAFLLMLSALFLRTAGRAAMLDPGFDMDHGVVAGVALDPGRSNESRVAFAEQLVEALRALPDVRSASVAGILPLAGDLMRRRFETPGSGSGPGAETYVNSVGPDYFRTMGIARLNGREFNRTDRTGAPAVVIVNQAFSTRYFQSDNPLGKLIRTGEEPYAEVVGVVADTKFLLLTEDPHPIVYYSYAQKPGDLVAHVSVGGSPESSVRAIRSAAEAFDPAALVTVDTLRQAAGLEVAFRRGAGRMLASLGSIGLLLALVGLYGVMSYTVAARRTEIGVRVALGASVGHVVSLVVTRAMVLTGAGLCLGLSSSLLLTIPLQSMLAGLSPVDPIALASTGVALLAGGACASYWPARRATRVDPMITLRQH